MDNPIVVSILPLTSIFLKRKRFLYYFLDKYLLGVRAFFFFLFFPLFPLFLVFFLVLSRFFFFF